MSCCFFFFSSRRRHTRSLCDWSSDVCSSDLDADQAANQAKQAKGADPEAIDSQLEDVKQLGTQLQSAVKQLAKQQQPAGGATGGGENPIGGLGGGLGATGGLGQ